MLPIVRILSGNAIVSSFIHALNALLSMVVSVLGKLISVKREHPAKALSPIIVVLFCISMEVR